MKIKSSAFKDNDFIPAKYTCDGDDINPPLEIFNVPDDAVSLALVVDDPDAPRSTGSGQAGGWVHWLVWNINPSTEILEENSVPLGASEGKTSFGGTGYGGPCPPSGVHRYFFKLYALDMTLDLSEESEIDALEAAMEGHVMAEANLMGRYRRSR